MAYLWHNAFQKIQAARKFKAHIAHYKYTKNANRFLKKVKGKIEDLTLAGKLAQEEMSKGKTSIATVWNSLDGKVEELKSGHDQVTKQVTQFFKKYEGVADLNAPD